MISTATITRPIINRILPVIPIWDALNLDREVFATPISDPHLPVDIDLYRSMFNHRPYRQPNLQIRQEADNAGKRLQIAKYAKYASGKWHSLDSTDDEARVFAEVGRFVRKPRTG